MSRETTWRSVPLPGNWGSIRRAVLARDPICRWGSLPGEEGWCDRPSTECDHIGEPDCHEVTMLRGLCKGHHNKRTRKQTSVAMKAWWNRRLRPQEKHPGYR
jgi:hypothetical protein